MLNWNVNMNGTYATTHPGRPDFTFNLSTEEFDVQQTFKHLPPCKRWHQLLNAATGNFSSDLSANWKLDSQCKAGNEFSNGKGKLTTQHLTINNFEPLNNLADALRCLTIKNSM
jgi:hypothetical protein